MDKELHDQLLQDINSLRQILEGCSTSSIVGAITEGFLIWNHGKDIGLSSPQRQLYFMLGLMLSTVEPSNAEKFSVEKLEKAKGLLENIYKSYALMYLPTSDEKGQTASELQKARRVAAPAYLNFLNFGLLANTYQVRDRIMEYLVPFDTEVEKLLGMSVTDMLKVTEEIGVQFEANYANLHNAGKMFEKEHTAFFEMAKRLNWTQEEIKRRAPNSQYGRAAFVLAAAREESVRIRLNTITETCGEDKVKTFCRLFSIRRGDAPELAYPDNPNPALASPLIMIDATTALLPHGHGLYLAILDRTERLLRDSEYESAFLQTRDQKLEEGVARIFGQYFPSTALILRSVYETPALEFEHDLIVHWRRKLFVVESKASPPQQPFRDPEKAYQRLRHNFGSDRGIQKAYEQAVRIEKVHRLGKSLVFYSAKREKVLELASENVDRVYCICVTRDSFGMLATDLSLLLSKEEDAPYPWAVNAFDLDSLLEAFNYLDWGPEMFCKYLDGRERMHGRVYADDELDFAGYLIKEGTFDGILNRQEMKFVLEPTYSKVFSEIFFAKMRGEAAPRRKHRQKPNDRCACGSGRKYKRCCGRG